MAKLALSVSHYFHDKENRAPEKPDRDGVLSNRWAFAAFDNVTWTTVQVIKHIRAGKAICVAATRNNHRKQDYFKSAQLMGVDFDKGPGVVELLRHRLIDDYAFLVYATPSNTDEAPRSRALFALDAPISDPLEYRRLLKRLMFAFGVENVDEQCKDPVRIFYGSAGRKISDVPSAVLPVEVLEALPPHPDEAPKPAVALPVRLVEPSDKRGMTQLEAYARTAKENILNDLALLPDGMDMRHGAINAATMKLAAFSKGGWSGVEGWESDIRQIGRQWGRADQEIEASIRGAYDKADPRPLGLPERAPVTHSVTGERVADPTPAQKVQEPASTLPTWHTSTESMQRYRERLTAARADGKLPLSFPFQALHVFGGFCRVVSPGVMIGVVGMSGGMKAQPLDSHVLTVNGWKRMGDIQIGDLVITMDGTPAPVTGIYPQGVKPIYRMTFKDGAEVECCDDHLWYVKTYADRANGRDWHVLPLKAFRESHQKQFTSGKVGKTCVPAVKPVQYPKRELPLDPYLLGVLIGDGGMTSTSLMISSEDVEILNAVRAVLPDGLQLKHSAAYDYRISGKHGAPKGQQGGGSTNPVIQALRELGLWGKPSIEKFIPADYLLADVESRISLLQGLCDTDGCPAGGHGTHVAFEVSSLRLAQDIIELVKSLGGVASCTEKPTYHNTAYRCHLQLPPDVLPFRLTRKLAKYTPRTKYPITHYIEQIEAVGEKEAQCIMVGHPSHSYITDGYVVTHNTSFVETITDVWKQMDANDVLWYGPEWNWEKMADRAVQRYGGANMTDVLLHELYLQEQARGLKPRDGRALPQGVYEASINASHAIEQWAGMNHYIEQMDVDIDDLLMGSAERLVDAKAMGRTIRIAVWDYLQLMDMRSARSEQDRITQILGRLKAFCVENSLIGIVASQVTKTATADTKENQKLLTSEAGQFFRGDKFNLVLTLNPIYEGKTLTDHGYINVDKNSIGRTGAVEVFINPARLKWLDSVAPDASASASGRQVAR